MSRLALLALAGFLTACGGDLQAAGQKTLRIPIPTDGPKNLDPVRGSTMYENQVCSVIFEGLLQYKYLKRPYELEPALLAEMPKVSGDGKTYSFRLKKGVRFQDNACFPEGKGREVVAKDVFYSWKRIANKGNDPKSWWLLDGQIKGFNEYRDEQNKAVENGGKFDYDAAVSGMRLFADDPYRFELILVEPNPTFQYKLAMFQLFVVPREAVEHYGVRFTRNPVGNGPFMLRKQDHWTTAKSIWLYKNPTYRQETYPDEYGDDDKKAGRHKAAGKRLPFLDKIEITFFVESQPMWLEFMSNNLDYTTVPAENFAEPFVRRSRKLRSRWRKRGATGYAVPLLDFIFRGFNMEDELVGGYTKKRAHLRRALQLAMDQREINDAFYNGINTIYDGPIPPGLAGYPPNGKAPDSLRGPSIERARAELAKAGYPGGKGLPKLDFWTGQASQAKEQTEMLQRQMRRIGVELNIHLVDFSTLIEKVHKKQAQMFSFAWGSDYPDPENNLALFYGPNEAPGSNSFNYKRPEYDKMYLRMRAMSSGPEREKLAIKMRDMVLSDVPYMGSMARTRFYVVRPWLLNCKPAEVFAGWWKYLDIDESKR